MQYKKLGKTGMKVTPFCLGTMTFGNQIGEAESIKVIKAAIDAGVNFFDSAEGYANGQSEEILGKGVKGDRQSVVIATKVGGGQPNIGSKPNFVGASRKYIMKAIEDSLKRLQTDYIDLYYVHFPDFDTPIEETLRTLDDLIHQGKVRYIGCSNFTAWQLCKALWASDVHNLAKFVCVQPPYNLLTRDVEFELLPFCANEGVGVCTYNPLAGEMLTGRHEFGKPPAEGRFTLKGMGQLYYQRYWSEMNFKAVDLLMQAAKARGCTLPQFSLAWILNNPDITAVLSGSISVDQLKENLASVEIKLTPEELQICDEVWLMFRPPRYFYGRDGRNRKE